MIYCKCILSCVGIDLAIIDNGYVYHTKSDRVEIIPMGTYQHLGDNLLALVRQIAGSPELANVDVSVINYIHF